MAVEAGVVAVVRVCPMWCAARRRRTHPDDSEPRRPQGLDDAA